MPPTSDHSIAEELRERIRVLQEDDQVALQQLHVIEQRKRDIEKVRARIQGAIYSYEKMLEDEEHR